MFDDEVTTTLIETYLDRHGWSVHQAVPEEGERQGIVLTGWGAATGEVWTMVIDPMAERKALSFRVPGVASAPPDATAADRLSGLLTAIGFINYELILGTWAYDPRDGEVSFRVSIPTDGGRLTYDVFEHCLRTTVVAVEAVAGALRGIVAGTTTAADVLRASGAPLA